MMYGWNDGYGSAFSWLGVGLMMCLWVLLLLGLVLLVVWFARGGSHRSSSGTSDACDIAKQRYARGEITKDEYNDICRTLNP